MPQREFDITIGADGHVEVLIKGFKGKEGCQSAAALLEKLVGHIDSLSETSEAYEPDQVVRMDQRH